ncbi:hypothetical protein ABZW03_04500 [Kitasatospora sp. NPDC004799]|uniref:hypothetical protein n=1 Tax=Kitasatospora sp. NPDC004799 TaxID=3154460 RepID=UPI00339E67A6
MGNLADAYGTDVEIYRWVDGLVRADCRTDAPDQVHHVLRRCGFTVPPEPGDPASYSIAPDLPFDDQRTAASAAAGMLDDAGYRVAIAPHLVVGYIGHNCTVRPDEQRLAAARRTSCAVANAAAPPGAPAPASRRSTTRTR